MDTRNDIAGPGLPLTPENAAIDRQQVKRLAQEFEAMLMTQMLREMRRSMLDEQEEQDDGFGAGAMTDTADIALGNALSQVGGLGLTESLLKAFEQQVAPVQEAVAAGPTNVADTRTVGLALLAGAAQGSAPPRLADVTSQAVVSSPFGWRQDPLTGVQRFHQGIDIAVAYGQDVKAAADGTVTFAGSRQGYGTTVVVDHAGGRQTRYAHLSEVQVQPGQPIAQGQVLGKSGNSGRTTGPHLHFEMLVDGRPVLPTHTVAE